MKKSNLQVFKYQDGVVKAIKEDPKKLVNEITGATWNRTKDVGYGDFISFVRTSLQEKDGQKQIFVIIETKSTPVAIDAKKLKEDLQKRFHQSIIMNWIGPVTIEGKEHRQVLVFTEDDKLWPEEEKVAKEYREGKTKFKHFKTPEDVIAYLHK